MRACTFYVLSYTSQKIVFKVLGEFLMLVLLFDLLVNLFINKWFVKELELTLVIKEFGLFSNRKLLCCVA